MHITQFPPSPSQSFTLLFCLSVSTDYLFTHALWGAWYVFVYCYIQAKAHIPLRFYACLLFCPSHRTICLTWSVTLVLVVFHHALGDAVLRPYCCYPSQKIESSSVYHCLHNDVISLLLSHQTTLYARLFPQLLNCPRSATTGESSGCRRWRERERRVHFLNLASFSPLHLSVPMAFYLLRCTSD